VKVIRVTSGNPGVARSCLGGCLLIIGWVVVGVINVFSIHEFRLPEWQAIVLGIVWLLSFPVCTLLYLKWRGRRHSKAFGALEGKMNDKVLDRLRKQSPDR
jgi:hypothetical protein